MPDIVPLVEIKNLEHRFPNGRLALEAVHLRIYPDSFTVIAGENGSGKTVLMKHLNGLLKPTGGEVLINGRSSSGDPHYARNKVGMVFQNSDTQIVAQTVREDIAFGPENLGLPPEVIRLRVESAASAMEIEHILEQSPHRLSGGEKKKLAIAGIMAMEPDLIVLDEPFAGLDFRGVKMLLSKLLDLRSGGTSLIVITHDLEKLLAHADRLIIMAAGRITGDGKPQELLSAAAEYGIRIPPRSALKEMTWLEGSP
jgi:biotin transport system ATP-binding protein